MQMRDERHNLTLHFQIQNCMQSYVFLKSGGRKVNDLFSYTDKN